MALYITTNISSINARRQLDASSIGLDTAFKRLASGQRINSAADDAAGLQISNRLQSQILGLVQGNRNANDGISLVQSIEGAMDEVTNMLQRSRTLAQQAANGSNTDQDRLALQEEVRALMDEVNRIAKDTTFGGENVLDGSYNGVFHVGADAMQLISFSMKSVGVTAAANDYALSTHNGFTLSGIAMATSAVIGERLTDLIGVSGISALSELNASITLTSMQFSEVYLASGISISSTDEAQLSLVGIDALISVVDKKRAELGAVQNRFQSTIRNQSNIAENLSQAKSRIKDADFAVETANLTKFQILQQASQTVLSQANQRSNTALSLLG